MGPVAEDKQKETLLWQYGKPSKHAPKERFLFFSA
jgi:hypothetical protein